MEEYKALSYIFRLSVELTKDASLFYHLGFLSGYTGEELILLLLYSRFNSKLSFYSILMSKYLVMASFLLFLIHLHHYMLTLGLDSYFSQMLTHLNLLQVLWPDHSLHASSYLGTPKTSSSDDAK